MKKILLTLLCILSMLSLHAQGTDSLPSQKMLSIGVMAPDMMIDSVNNISLATMRGRFVVLHFWASTDPASQGDMSDYKQLSYACNSDSVVFINISYDTDKDAWQHYISENPMFGLQISELKPLAEAATAKMFHISSIPAYYVINTQGRIIESTTDVKQLAERLSHLDHSRVNIPKSKASKNPEYNGGPNMLRLYLAKNINYPRIGSNYGLEGQTIVKFTVEANGSITGAHVVENRITVEDKLPFQKLHGDEKERVRKECLEAFAEEALRVVNSMPAWIPGKRYGVPEKVEYELPINFRMKYNQDDAWGGQS